jgi:hypothetical protein
VAPARARRHGRAGGRGIDPIETYLGELRGRLGRDPLFRRRVLAEVEDHLREAAAREGAEPAIRRFGSPAHVAGEFAGERVASAAVWCASAVIVAAGAFLAAYGFGERMLPPAPWASPEATPASLRWKVAAIEIAYAVAAVCAVATLAAAWRRAARLAVALGAAATIALGTAAGVTVVEAFERASLYEELGVSGRPSEVSLALGTVWLVALTGLAGAGVGWAARVARTAHRASRSYGLSR